MVASNEKDKFIGHPFVILEKAFKEETKLLMRSHPRLALTRSNVLAALNDVGLCLKPGTTIVHSMKGTIPRTRNQKTELAGEGNRDVQLAAVLLLLVTICSVFRLIVRNNVCYAFHDSSFSFCLSLLTTTAT